MQQLTVCCGSTVSSAAVKKALLLSTNYYLTVLKQCDVPKGTYKNILPKSKGKIVKCVKFPWQERNRTGLAGLMMVGRYVKVRRNPMHD